MRWGPARGAGCVLPALLADLIALAGFAAVMPRRKRPR
jgi:hypothetical protein